MSPSRSSNLTESSRPAGLVGRFREKLAATQQRFTRGMADLLLGQRTLDEGLFEELEALLLSADVGVDTTQLLLRGITDQVSRRQLNDSRAVYQALRQRLLSMMKSCSRPLVITPVKPFVMLVVGVNGVGKTTTIAKLAQRFKNAGHTVMLAAADTFRAAAIDQLKEWGGRVGVEVIATQPGGDPGAVVYDAIAAARARGADLVIVDTAGRLHTKFNLMEELKKVRGVAAKASPGAPHAVYLVLDSTTGQNALAQAKAFKDTAGVTGVVLSKLDGSAKGGVAFAIRRELNLPIVYAGLGERLEDLAPFDPAAFVDGLLE